MMLSCTLGFPVTAKLLCASGTLSSDLVLLPLFLLFPTETDFVSQHFSLFLFYCIPTGKKLEVCIDNCTSDTVTAGNFERENLREFWGFVSIRKSFLSICKSFSVNVGGVASFGSTSKQSATVFSTEIVFSTNLWKFFPSKIFCYPVFIHVATYKILMGCIWLSYYCTLRICAGSCGLWPWLPSQSPVLCHSRILASLHG